LKILPGRKFWVFAAVGLTAVVVLAISMRWHKQELRSESAEPPVEAERLSSVLVRDMDLVQRARQKQLSGFASSPTIHAAPLRSVASKVVKAAPLPVTVTSTKSPVIQPPPFKKNKLS